MGHPAQSPLRIAIFISGRGSNMQALVDVVRDERLPVHVVAVVSNEPQAAGLDWARAHGLPTRVVLHRDFTSRAAFEAALQAALEPLAPDCLLLAGFMRVLSAPFVRHFERRIINIHPSLLPAFPGLDTHGQALAAGVQWHGCTVHYVTPTLDAGPIIAQGVVPVLHGDTPARLAARLLPVEHRVYAQVLRWLAAGELQLDATGRVRVAQCAHRAWLGDAPVVWREAEAAT